MRLNLGIHRKHQHFIKTQTHMQLLPVIYTQKAYGTFANSPLLLL